MPQSSLTHLGIYLCIFVVLDVIAVDVLASQFDKSLGQKVDADVFSFEEDVSNFDLACLPLDDEGEVFAWVD